MWFPLLLLVPICCGLFYRWVVLYYGRRFFSRRPCPQKGNGRFVSLIKPLCGAEKNLARNLRSALTQDYPDYEVVFSLQDRGDPASEIVDRLIAEFPHRRVKKVVNDFSVGPNGRLNNIRNATEEASGEWLVYTDSDMFLPPDYLSRVTAPLADPQVGVSGTVYRGARADTWYEALELLSLNTDFIPSVIFATESGASIACLGGSQAIRREVLNEIGGLEPLAPYLVEDFELGRRVVAAGYKILFEPVVIETEVGLSSPKEWWRHQVYWDQNTRAANPVGFFFTWLIREIPFSLLYSFCVFPFWPAVLCATIVNRLLTARLNARLLGDTETPKHLWFLPLRDLAGIFIWFASLVRRKVYWKGRKFLVRKGLMVEI